MPDVNVTVENAAIIKVDTVQAPSAAYEGSLIAGAVDQPIPVDADKLALSDGATGALKRLSWSNLKATLKTYFDTLYLSAVSWANVSGKPTTFPPSTHTTSHAAGGSDVLTPADIGAAKSGLATGSDLTMSTGKLLGRATAAVGAIEEITLGTGLSFTGTTLNAAAGGGSSKMKAALLPGAANLVGATDEPLLVGVASATTAYPHWDELRYSDTTAQEAIWLVSSVLTKDYAGGQITVRLRWKAVAITGNVVWQIRLLGRTAGEAVDVAFDATAHGGAVAVSGVTETIVESAVSFIPLATELTAGDTWFIGIQRIAADAADTLIGDAKLIDAGVFET